MRVFALFAALALAVPVADALIARPVRVGLWQGDGIVFDWEQTGRDATFRFVLFYANYVSLRCYVSGTMEEGWYGSCGTPVSILPLGDGRFVFRGHYNGFVPFQTIVAPVALAP